jgi:hypothetical protein
VRRALSLVVASIVGAATVPAAGVFCRMDGRWRADACCAPSNDPAPAVSCGDCCEVRERAAPAGSVDRVDAMRFAAFEAVAPAANVVHGLLPSAVPVRVFGPPGAGIRVMYSSLLL